MRLIEIQALYESGGSLYGNFPIKSMGKVFHVGEFDPKKRKSESHEWNGLSVSLHPEEWRGIARLGNAPVWTLSNDNGKFLMFHSLSEDQKLEIEKWGLSQGYVESGHHYNVSAGGGGHFSFFSKDEAEKERGPRQRIKTAKGLIPTDKMRAESQRGDRIDPVFVFDYLVILFAEKKLGVDGVWWADRLRPADYSAPRGVIFLSHLPNWQKDKVLLYQKG